MCPTPMNCVTLIPLTTSDIVRPIPLISGHNIKKRPIVRNAIHKNGNIDTLTTQQVVDFATLFLALDPDPAKPDWIWEQNEVETKDISILINSNYRSFKSPRPPSLVVDKIWRNGKNDACVRIVKLFG